MSDICCCSVEEKIITVRDVVVNQHDLLRSLDGKLRNIAREIGCDPAPEIDPPCGVDSMLAALQENDMWLRDCLDHTCEIIRVLGVGDIPVCR